jgi:hypothetical protein
MDSISPRRVLPRGSFSHSPVTTTLKMGGLTRHLVARRELIVLRIVRILSGMTPGLFRLRLDQMVPSTRHYCARPVNTTVGRRPRLSSFPAPDVR